MDSDISGQLQFTRRQITYGLCAGGIILFIIFGAVWWFKVYQNPQRTFWDMISNGLATSGVTRHVTETASGQTLDEYIQLELGGHNEARTFTSLKQNNNVVETESIGTPTTDYTRYTGFTTTAKNSKGQPLDFGKVIGLWGKSAPPAKGKKADPLQHLFAQTLLGIVPIANLPQTERSALMKTIRSNNVFVPDFSSVATKTVNGQRAYVYDVSVEPVAYAIMLQALASDEGLGTISELNPSNYQGASPLQIKFAVGTVSHQLLRINYVGSNHIENYSGYGEQPNISIPTKTISTSALEQRLATVK